MKTVDAAIIKEKVKAMIADCVCSPEENVCRLLALAEKNESNPNARYALEIINRNNALAKKERCPACQDTGLAVFFVEIGSEIQVTGESVEDALNSAVREAYSGNYCRMSVLSPLNRINSGDNTPAVIHYTVTEGARLKVSYLSKGAGAENMSALKMLTPADGKEGATAFILDTVRRAGANPCPPVILGIGIGGTMEKAALLSKRALTRKTGEPSKDPEIADYEKELLDKVNGLKIGAQGFGGDTTCLAVHIETFPTHIGMLPVSVNIQCHSARHGEVVF